MKGFSIRVYGILQDEQQRILLSDEYIRGMFITKFPGGGLELGEGTRDCLVREFKEELNLSISVGHHIYTTDYFQISAFNNQYQIISIYYQVHALEPITAPVRLKPFDFDAHQMEAYHKTGETETARFIAWDNFNADALTLPIDKIVANLLIEK